MRIPLLVPSETAIPEPFADAPLRDTLVLKALTAICRLRLLITSDGSGSHVNSPFSTGAAKTPAFGPQLRPGGSYPLATSRLRDPDRRDRGGARKSVHCVSDVTDRTPLPVPAWLVTWRVLYSPARVGRLASRLRRLARRLVVVQWRLPVPRVDVAERRRCRSRVSVVCAGADVSGVCGVASGRRLGRMGKRSSVWAVIA